MLFWAGVGVSKLNTPNSEISERKRNPFSLVPFLVGKRKEATRLRGRKAMTVMRGLT